MPEDRILTSLVKKPVESAGDGREPAKPNDDEAVERQLERDDSDSGGPMPNTEKTIAQDEGD